MVLWPINWCRSCKRALNALTISLLLARISFSWCQMISRMIDRFGSRPLFTASGTMTALPQGWNIRLLHKRIQV
ncbi:hypothetical protein M433DRAFT_308347 [Acidomyces richmondensis BFW]|nr:MAG: hypothetical protein FE78DRAFT_294843 [Acidomyces sp. 'richmondensis']KYG44332.1 hypothetical protein M433DRAFT_308347 [Acidomyces richmondensis BFW]